MAAPEVKHRKNGTYSRDCSLSQPTQPEAASKPPKLSAATPRATPHSGHALLKRLQSQHSLQWSDGEFPS